MRQILLDTETTGFEPSDGHRIIEIGCVELIKRRVTRNTFHRYINPGRGVDEGAQSVHGLSNSFLADKPRFAEIAADFIDYIRDAEVIIHNAPFDVGFIDHELSLLGRRWGKLEDYCTVTDSLELARKKHPRQRCSLDALCKRYSIDSSRRELHGALLDAELLAGVYLAMTGGQATLALGGGGDTDESGVEQVRALPSDRPRLPVPELSDSDCAAHEQLLQRIDKSCSSGQALWRSQSGH
ncbi:DNA polymerase III subunit epsilon [Halorhodospira halochloris]|uniref:DNA polymerase III subunit epsilon n=1 Tax=Halorhodospira halochloris TaxID=1052 RepID=A0A0X8XA40_HALHR|nr:DNA polymerase III subunit epsilon [Halorhodospira halochloris]MBK1651929.1 DNA polymerase III subunit epsilon [Halorhodospira halochloris]MCG5530370.1 DNA polymerase III subunit epsilon [Halorhodospira halochloris]MCG5547962.1 DNA polymerase III subunit epsilon [Halorhodospira halochloris]BAU58220.1 DNA polymerase III epsilon subunit [Halorhodospira halochloris]